MCVQSAIRLIGRIISCPKTNWPGIFVYSGGRCSLPIKLLLLGCPSMVHHHPHKFPVYYKYVKDSLVLDEFILWLLLPVDSLRKQVSS